MTINTISVSTGPYVGTGTTDTYAYDFKIQLSSEIVVKETTDAGVESTLVEGTDYTVYGAGDNGGGTVVRSAGNLPAAYEWLISRDTALTQLADFPGQGAFTPLSHENAFDKVHQILQEVNSKSIDVPAANRSDKVYSFDSSGDAEANISAVDLRAVMAASLDAGLPATVDTFTGDGSTTAFVLSVTPLSVNAVYAIIDGVLQKPTVAYTLSGSTLTFTEAPPDDAEIVIRNMGNAKSWSTGQDVGLALWPRTSGEIAAAVTPANYAQMPNNAGAQSILRHGANTIEGTTDMAPAAQAAVNSLSDTEGGVLLIPAGRYSFQSTVSILGTKFINGGVMILMHPRAVIEVEGSATAAFEFVGAAEATPINNCSVFGGRIVGTTDGAAQGLLFKYTTNCYVSPQTSVVGFKSTVRSTRAGIFCQYSIWFRTQAQIDNCDYGLNCEGNAADTFRGTTTEIGGSIRTCYRGVRLEDMFSVDVNAWIENCSIGLQGATSRTTVNSAGVNVAGHFEGNGLHCQVLSEGTGRAKGWHFNGALFELVTTNYAGGGGAFEDSGAGDYKIDIDGDDCVIDANYWSTGASVKDIRLRSTAERTHVRKQLGAFDISDSSSSSVYEKGSYTEYLSIADGDATPDLRGGNSYVTGNTSPTTITDFEATVPIGAEVVIRLGDSQTTIDFSGTNLRGNGGVDWSPNTNDLMVCRKVTATIWLCEVHET